MWWEVEYYPFIIGCGGKFKPATDFMPNRELFLQNFLYSETNAFGTSREANNYLVMIVGALSIVHIQKDMIIGSG